MQRPCAHAQQQPPTQHTRQLDNRRPGILVLVNGCDWELSGALDTELSPGDAVVFISTLHGG